MLELVSNQTLKKKEYVCQYCKIIETEKDNNNNNNKSGYQSNDQAILEEIKRIIATRLNIYENWELFKKYSNFKITFERFSKIYNNKIRNQKES